MMFRTYVVLLALGLAVATGCNQNTSTLSPEMLSAYQSSLSLASEPDQAVSILEVRESLSGTETTAATVHTASAHAHDEASPDDHDEAAPHDHDDSDHHGEDGNQHDSDAGHTTHPDENAAAGQGQTHNEHAHDEHAHDEHAHDEHAHDEHDHDEHDHGHAGHEHGSHGHGSDGRSVVIVGKIGGAAGADKTLSDFPWEKGRATFIISDPSFEPAHAHDHEHSHDHECHFCQAQATDAQAWVRFLGDDDEPIAVDARELFGVKEGDIVVVQGEAKISAGMLIVDATGIYVRK